MTAQPEQEEELIAVRNADSMSPGHFQKHMESRHQASLGRFGVAEFGDEYLERCWRAFHRQIHALGLHGDLDHYHGR